METFKSFDGLTSVTSSIYNYTHKKDKKENFLIDKSYVPRGSGSSPRLISAYNQGKCISISPNDCNQKLGIDVNEKLISVCPSSTFAEINKYAFGFGLELPVVPGLQDITIGAGIATCVHGKNQFMYDFGSQIISFEILSFKNELIFCSDKINSEIFHLTIGGLGSTGLILNVVLKLKSIISTLIHRNKQRVIDSNDFLDFYNDSDSNLIGMFGWHDLHTTKKKFGGGFGYKDYLIPGEEILYSQSNTTIEKQNAELPLKILSLGKYLFGYLFNKVYVVKENLKPNESKFNAYTGAQSSKGLYWNILRSNGFFEIQFIVPNANYLEFMEYVRFSIKKYNATTSVCISKPSKGERGYFRFRGDGVNLDMTALKSKANFNFLNDINLRAISFGAIPNISKCSILQKSQIELLYGDQGSKFYSDYYKIFGEEPPKWFLNNGFYDSKNL